MTAPVRILVLCTGNSARSQIAEAMIGAWGGGLAVAESAGSQPAARVNPLAVRALAEIGIDWGGREPRGLESILGQPWDLVLTVCDNAREVCPVLPGAVVTAHWGQPDPAEATGDEVTREKAFRAARDLLAWRIRELLGVLAAHPDQAMLREQARRIGTGHPPG